VPPTTAPRSNGSSSIAAEPVSHEDHVEVGMRGDEDDEEVPELAMPPEVQKRLRSNSVQ